MSKWYCGIFFEILKFNEHDGIESVSKANFGENNEIQMVRIHKKNIAFKRKSLTNA